MQIELEQMPPLRLAAIPHTGPYKKIGPAFERLGEIAGRAGLFAHPGAMMLGAYDTNSDGKKEEELRSYAGVTVPEDVSLPDGVEEVQINGATYARYSHIGPLNGLADAWSRFMSEALPASGYTVADGPALEIYRSDMSTTPAEELRTDLLVPVR